MSKLLSKSKFVGGWQCEKQAFLTANFPKLATPYDSAALARFAGGTRFGELAQSVWPNGVLVDAPAFRHDASVKRTLDLIDSDCEVIFEAGFTALGTRVRADVMIRNSHNSEWDLVEVKSSSSPKHVHDVDMAIQRAVIEASDIAVGKTGLMLVNSEYVRGDQGIEPDGLFKTVDRTEEVKALLPSMLTLNERLHSVINSASAPDISIGPHCEAPYECPFFDHCTADRPGDWVRYLPGVGLKKVAEFETRSKYSIRSLSGDEKLTTIQIRATRSVSDNKPWISDQLKDLLGEIGSPIRFIDFETKSPTIPLYPGTSPREVIPFQWSSHTLQEDGSIEHSEFLASGEIDPRREFIESLLGSVKREGPVLIYSSYEKTTLRKLAEIFPDLSTDIETLISRFVDLLAIIRNNYYHPYLKGSFSIKKVLPVLVPGYDYADLEVGDGETASAVFVDIVEGRIDEYSLHQTQSDLLAYCERDTEAMLLIWQRLREIAGS